MKRVIAERYDPNDWNIYAAQASDGDNVSSDGPTATDLLRANILPACQHFAYLEVGDENGPRAGFVEHRTTLWRTYEAIAKAGGPIAMRKVNHRRRSTPCSASCSAARTRRRREPMRLAPSSLRAQRSSLGTRHGRKCPAALDCCAMLAWPVGCLKRLASPHGTRPRSFGRRHDTPRTPEDRPCR